MSIKARQQLELLGASGQTEESSSIIELVVRMKFEEEPSRQANEINLWL